jgi:hypothetical protein
MTHFASLHLDITLIPLREHFCLNTFYVRRGQMKMEGDLKPIPRRAYRVKEFCQAFGVCPATVYNLMAAGKLRTVRIAGRRLIPADVAEGLLRQEP